MKAVPGEMGKKDRKLKELSILTKIAKHFMSNYMGKLDCNNLSFGLFTIFMGKRVGSRFG